MEYKILEANGIEIENIDGGAFNNFSAGDRSGIVSGVLNECKVVAFANSLMIDTGLLLIKGVRIKIIEPKTFSLVGTPTISLKYSLIAKVSINSSKDVVFDMFTTTETSLIQDNLYKTESGTYEFKIATFVYNTDGNITNLKTTANIIKAGSDVTVDDALSLTSTNPVQNKVITDKIAEIRQAIVPVDSELSNTSTNPVQNRVITEALRNSNVVVIEDDLFPESISPDTFIQIAANGTNKTKSFLIFSGDLVGQVCSHTVYSVSVLVDQKLYKYKLENPDTMYITTEKIDLSNLSGGSITVDSELSETSENPVQNKVITQKVNGLAEISPVVFRDDLFPESMSYDTYLDVMDKIGRGGSVPPPVFIVTYSTGLLPTAKGIVCSYSGNFFAGSKLTVLVDTTLYTYTQTYNSYDIITDKIDLANLGGGSDCNTVILEDTLFPDSLEVQILQKLLGEVSTDVEITSSVVIWNNSNGTFGQLCARSYADRTATSVVGDIIYKYKLVQIAADEWMVDTTKIESVSKEYVDDKVGDIETAKNQSQETAITLTPIANNEYYYGELVSLNLNFGTANLGDMFYITFNSGATATVLTVDSTNAIFEDFVPNENACVEIMGKWNGSKWIVLFSQTIIGG